MKIRTPIDTPLVGPVRAGPKWEYYSPRLRNRLTGIGELSCDYFVQLECSPSVASFRPWPDADSKTHIPEAQVNYADGHVEIHYLKGAEPAIQIKSAEGNASAPRVQVLSAEKIRREEEFLRNCYALIPWMSRLHEKAASNRAIVIANLLIGGGPLTIHQFAQRCGIEIPGLLPSIAFEYVAGHLLILDIRKKPFGRQSLIMHTSHAPQKVDTGPF